MKLLKSIFYSFCITILLFSSFGQIVDSNDSSSFTLSRVRSYVKRSVTVPPAVDATAVVDKVTPAVVSVYGLRSAPVLQAHEESSISYQPLGSVFNILRPKKVQVQEVSAGTGFFIDSDGYILTNKHVVSEEEAAYVVELTDGQRKGAEVVYRDPNNDLAVLKISGEDYPTMALGDSSSIKIGAMVLGVGNAFGQFKNTPTAGAVTGIRKTILAHGEGKPQKLKNLIETSTQLYPGYSGGPLFDLEGKVVGVNVAMALSEETIGYSIPINDAKNIIKKYADEN